MRRGIVVGLVLGAALVALAAPAASASPTLVTRADDLGRGPHLSAVRLFYGELGSENALRLKLAAPGGPPRFIYTGSAGGSSSDDDESPGNYSFTTSSIAASPDRLAYGEASGSGNARYQVGNAAIQLFGGPAGGEFGPVDSCSHSNYFGPSSSAVDADGQLVASVDCNGQIVIRDYSRGAEPAVTRVSPGQGLAASTLAIAGRYVAYEAHPIGPTGSSPDATFIHDWLTGTKVYEAPGGGQFDLQFDGKLVLQRGAAQSCDQGSVAWYSPAEPTAHVLPVKPCSGTVRIAADKIALVSVEDGERKLTLFDLDGTRRVAADLGAGLQRGTIDYDGARVAYGLRNCIEGTDLLTENATFPQPRAEDPACPARIRSSSAALGPNDRFMRAVVECPRGCAALLFVRTRVLGELQNVGFRRIRVAPETPCAAQPQQYGIRLSAAARRELRRRRVMRAVLYVDRRDRAGVEQRTTRKIELRAGKRDRGTAPGGCGR
jgi:hypothetical protein